MKNDSLAPRADTPTELANWIRRARARGVALAAFAQPHQRSPQRGPDWGDEQRRKPARPPKRAPAGFQELQLATGLPRSRWAVEISQPAGPVVRFSAAATPAGRSARIQTLRRPW